MAPYERSLTSCMMRVSMEFFAWMQAVAEKYDITMTEATRSIVPVNELPKQFGGDGAA